MITQKRHYTCEGKDIIADFYAYNEGVRTLVTITPQSPIPLSGLDVRSLRGIAECFSLIADFIEGGEHGKSTT